MVNIEFVPYELSLKLKAIGFDEPCLAIYRRGSLYGSGTSVNRYYEDGDWKLDKNSDYTGALDQWVAAPTFSQAFRWFREKYKLINIMEYYNEWNYEILRIDENISEPQDDLGIDYTYKGGTYEEAKIDCLEKLIEIVESKSK
jgi:hypothetical protein